MGTLSLMNKKKRTDEINRIDEKVANESRQKFTGERFTTPTNASKAGNSSYPPYSCIMDGLQHLCKYMINIPVLKYDYNSEGIETYTDSDYATEEDRKSISGCGIKVNGCLVSWHSKKQSVVAVSACEAEIIASCDATKRGQSVKNLVNEFSVII